MLRLTQRFLRTFGFDNYKVKKRATLLFEPFIYKSHDSTKTGLGQT